MRDKSIEEHKYTSTGAKFWKNMAHMLNYRRGLPGTVISTHISPEGACNLKCPYCSVTHRKVHNRIDPGVIEDYVLDLKTVGLKAVILTGGGEPTIYPDFNGIVPWLKRDMGLSVALITNGTQARRVDPRCWQDFSWIRFSINIFDGWEEKIQLPRQLIDFDSCVVGASFVFTQKHEHPTPVDIDLLKRVAAVARNSGARYVRVLPNCLLPQSDLLRSHSALDRLLEEVGDDIFFHQYKVHGAPDGSCCHQSYFRPYLSEVPYKGSDVPGSVYPCDSVVLNDGVAHFADKFQLCAPRDVLQYVNGTTQQPFDATVDCHGCVFTDNVNMLGKWRDRGVYGGPTSPYLKDLIHEEFV